jgi:hypothetical protein
MVSVDAEQRNRKLRKQALYGAVFLPAEVVDSRVAKDDESVVFDSISPFAEILHPRKIPVGISRKIYHSPLLLAARISYCYYTEGAAENRMCERI